MISFIVPAHNEEAWVGRCVSAIRSAMELVGEPNEVLVVDDASTDATGWSPSNKARKLSGWSNRQ